MVGPYSTDATIPVLAPLRGRAHVRSPRLHRAGRTVLARQPARLLPSGILRAFTKRPRA